LPTGLDISKNNAFDVPPPGEGLTTVTVAVPAMAMSVAGIDAVIFPALTKVVVRGLLFQFTTEPETNPAPRTVSVNPGPPGTALAGAMG
jgi:hypothetical protein